MKQPQRFPLDKIYDILPTEIKQNRSNLSYRDKIGVAFCINRSIFRLLKMASSPYLIEDYRLGVVIRGSMHGIINLREHFIREGSIVFITPGTIVEPIEVSDDLLMEGMGLPADKFQMAHNGKFPEIFNGQTSDGRKVISEDDIITLDRMLRLLHYLMERKSTPENVLLNMVTVITHFFSHLFNGRGDAPQPISHSNEIFNQFLRLVNLYGKQEHQLAFYADKLCITSRYLSTLVHTTSGISAKEWIDRAIITSAKVLLKHSDKQSAQIADELCFPNASFFCKYFKRNTGFTPQQYRNMKTNQ